MMNIKFNRYFFIVLMVGILLWSLYQSFFMNNKYIEISYTEFQEQLSKQLVKSVIIEEKTIKLTLKDGSKFSVYVPWLEDSVVERIRASGVEIISKPPRTDWLGTLFSSVLPVVALLFLVFFFFRQLQGANSQAFSFGRSKAKLFLDNKPKVTFKDAAGVEESKLELQEVVEFLKDPRKFQALGAKIPKGVLLVGPPGCGKTLLARAVAGEANVPFFTVSGSEFVELFVGVGASRVRDLFDQAKKQAPCIIFIDEIDAVGRQRGAGIGGGHDEREQTLNQLLVEMDGFDPYLGVIVIAATNRPDILDAALLRPGRFDRRILIDLPDIKGRYEILQVHSKGKPLAPEVNLENLAKRTPGFTGADLGNLLNEAALLAARRGKKMIFTSELEEAVDRIIAGPQKSRVVSEKEKVIIAIHETGHALVSRFIPEADPIHRISVVSRGRALGYTVPIPSEDRYIFTKDQLLAKISVYLGGRVAEETLLNEITTGAENDLEQATEIARRMVVEYGMSKKLGPISYAEKEGMVFLGKDLVKSRALGGELASLIDNEVKIIIDGCYEKVKSIILDNKDLVEEIAQVLREKEILQASDLDEIINDYKARKQVN